MLRGENGSSRRERSTRFAWKEKSHAAQSVTSLSQFRVQTESPNVSPRRIFFEVGFPLFPHRIGHGERCISLSPKVIPLKPPKTYPNPLLLALKYKRLLDTPGIGNQTELARKAGVSRARINQLLRLLKLPPHIQQSVIRLGDPLPSCKITERKLRALFTSPQSK